MPKRTGEASVRAGPPERGGGIRVFGVDPGLTATGFGVIEMAETGALSYLGSGVLRPRPGHAFPQRLQQIFLGLCRQIELYSPRIMGVERPFLAKNVKSAMLLGQARGAAMLAAAECGLEVKEYSPLEVKQAVVGYGRALKEQVQVMIRSLLNVPEKLPPDAADALGVAICLAHSFSWQMALQRGRRRPFSRPEATSGLGEER